MRGSFRDQGRLPSSATRLRFERVGAESSEPGSERRATTDNLGIVGMSARRDPEDLLRRDGELRGFLDASVGYSPHLLYVLIADRAGRIIVHTERPREGTVAPALPSLDALLNENVVSRFLTLSHAQRIVPHLDDPQLAVGAEGK